ncbi:deoxyguanosinetriphosphate triphosphohydrolase [Humidisolicoccus flavus]|uniref:deoxyguanosinetriphosphate triphosphohydrolase n=1 Tax=Humidisolicoccus flavus TaxID=3111414 RepID=UPI00324B3D3F
MVVESAYGAHASARWFEGEQHTTSRGAFARDRARLLHSSSLRRLAQKTQVLSPTAGLDFARNRLTHSLEVAQVGRELAFSLGLEPDIVDTACLAHDIGHPPFGHNGETALNIWAAGIGGFEGNAQTLRVLTRLEPKIMVERSYGLNLTRASLDAACKYPWPDTREVLDPSGRVKFGFYAEDVDAFEWIRQDAPPLRRCIEAEVMDLADDIAYSVHDFEDAIVGGFIDPQEMTQQIGEDSLLDRMQSWVGGEYTRDELAAACERLAALSDWPSSWTGERHDQARLKNLTSKLIGRFAVASARLTREVHGPGSLARFAATVEVPSSVRCEIAALKGIVAAYVMEMEQRQPLYAEQRLVLISLADALLEHGETQLDVAFQEDWRVATTDAARRRVVVDQLASLTDLSALNKHRELVG